MCSLRRQIQPDNNCRCPFSIFPQELPQFPSISNVLLLSAIRHFEYIIPCRIRQRRTFESCFRPHIFVVSSHCSFKIPTIVSITTSVTSKFSPMKAYLDGSQFPESDSCMSDPSRVAKAGWMAGPSCCTQSQACFLLSTENIFRSCSRVNWWLDCDQMSSAHMSALGYVCPRDRLCMWTADIKSQLLPSRKQKGNWPAKVRSARRQKSVAMWWTVPFVRFMKPYMQSEVRKVRPGKLGAFPHMAWGKNMENFAACKANMMNRFDLLIRDKS